MTGLLAIVLLSVGQVDCLPDCLPDCVVTETPAVPVEVVVLKKPLLPVLYRGPVRIHFYTSATCGPCQTVHWYIDQLAAMGFPAYETSFEDFPQEHRRLQVASWPTWIVFTPEAEPSQRRELQRFSGTRTSFQQLLDALRNHAGK